MVDAARDRAMRALIEGTAEIVALVNELGVVEYISPSVTPMLGWDPSDIVGQSVVALIHPDDLAAAIGAITENIATPADGLLDRDDFATTDEYRLKHRDGRWVAVEAIGNNLLLTEGVNGMLVVGRVVTARHRLDQALTSLATKPVDVQGLADLVGLVDELLRGTAAALLVDGEWIAPQESAAPRPDVDAGPWVRAVTSGEMVLEPTSAAPFRAVWSLPLGDPGCLVVWSTHHAEPLIGWWATLRRVSDLATLALGRLRAERALQHEATHDALTGVLNRSGFIARVSESRARGAGALLLADLDGFKPVNDRHGHAVGDAVLAIVAQRVAAVLRPDDLMGRFGGDEFVVFLPGADADVATLVAGRLLEALDEPISVGDVRVRLGVSIGIDTSTTRTLDEQLTVADAALYRAKNAGRGRVEVAQADFTAQTAPE